MTSSRADGVFCHQDTVTSAQHGNPEAFRSLYDTHAPGILGYLRTIVGEADAEDVASETWFRIHRALAGYHRARGDFRTWATAIARNQAISHLRYRQSRPSFPVPPDSIPHRPSVADTEHDATESMQTARTLALLRELPRSQAAAVLLCVVLGLDAATAGRILRKQPAAVRMAAHRGIKALRLVVGLGAESESSL